MIRAIMTILLLASSAWADHADVDVIASVSTVRPGSTFTVGVRFKIDQKWHIYWKNPGDSGLATTIKTTPSAGLSPGAPQFPVPKRMVLPGEIVNYGYDSEVVFLVPVTVGADTPMGPATVKVNADYLVCSEQCLPGKFSGEVKVTVGSTDTPDHAEEFAAAATKMPLNDSGPTARSWLKGLDYRPSTDGKAVRMSMTLRWAKAPEKVDWMPEPIDDCDVNDIKVTTADGETHVSFTIVPTAGKTVPALAFGIVGYEDTGIRVGVSTKHAAPFGRK